MPQLRTYIESPTRVRLTYGAKGKGQQKAHLWIHDILDEWTFDPSSDGWKYLRDESSPDWEDLRESWRAWVTAKPAAPPSPPKHRPKKSGPPRRRRSVTKDEIMRHLSIRTLTEVIDYAQETFAAETPDFQDARVSLRENLRRLGDWCRSHRDPRGDDPGDPAF